MLAHRMRVFFNSFVFVVADKLCVSADKTTVEDSTGQTPIVLRFNRVEVPRRNARLFRDVAQSNTPRLAFESQLFSDARCHLYRPEQKANSPCEELLTDESFEP